MKKNPMTREGYKALQDKLHRLKTVDRPGVIQAIATARSYGDLSENAEYSAAKEKQSFIEYQIQLISQKLQHAYVVDQAKMPKNTVSFGSLVTVKCHNNGSVSSYTIVGEDEADINENKLSCQSPLAKSLMGKTIGDQINLTTPRGKTVYEILEIQ